MRATFALLPLARLTPTGLLAARAPDALA